MLYDRFSFPFYNPQLSCVYELTSGRLREYLDGGRPRVWTAEPTGHRFSPPVGPRRSYLPRRSLSWHQLEHQVAAIVRRSSSGSFNEINSRYSAVSACSYVATSCLARLIMDMRSDKLFLGTWASISGGATHDTVFSQHTTVVALSGNLGNAMVQTILKQVIRPSSLPPIRFLRPSLPSRPRTSLH